jgi:hypothetical protein
VDVHVQVVLCVVGAVLAATVYGSFFATGGYLPRLAAVAVVATAVAGTTAAYRLPAVLSAGISVAAFAVTATFVVLTGTLHAGLPTATTATTGARALTGGWAAMLSIAVPAPLSPAMLMTPAALTWTAAFVATSAVRRTRSNLAPAGALVGSYAAGLLFVADQPGAHLAQVSALLAVVLALVVLRANAAATGGRRRVVGAVVAVVVVAAAFAGTSAEPFVRGEHRFDPRTLLHPHLHLNPTLSPLAEVRAQLQHTPSTALFTVTVTAPGSTGVDRIQVATLDTFDGARWTSSDTFHVAGPALTPGPAITGAATVTGHVTISGLGGPFLPAIGRPTTIRTGSGLGGQVGFDARSGDLVTDAATLTGASYDVTGLRHPADAAIEHAVAGTGPAYAAYTTLPAVPAPITVLASRLVANAASPYAKLTAIANYLRRLPYSLNAAPGESYAAVLRLLAPGSEQDAAGYAEQHAAAFAVLARYEGLPTRITVGYLLRGAPAGGTFTVTTADAYAWTQVYFEGYGWVDFDPTDPSKVTNVAPDEAPPTAPTTVPLPQQPSPPSGAMASASPVPVVQARSGPGWPHLLLPALGYGGAGLLGALLAAETINLAAKTHRRRRRRRGDAASRVSGAWLETLDRLDEAGVRIPASLTAEEVAERAASADDVTRRARTLRRAARTLAELAPMASYSVFAAEPPDRSAAARAWLLEHRLRGEIYPRRLVARRIADRLKPIRLRRPRRRARRTGVRA